MPRELLVTPECERMWEDENNAPHFCMLSQGHTGLVHVCSCDAALVVDPPVMLAPAAKGPYTPRRRCLMTRLIWRLLIRWSTS